MYTHVKCCWPFRIAHEQKENILETDKLSIEYNLKFCISRHKECIRKKLSYELVFTLNRIRHGANTLLLILKDTEWTRKKDDWRRRTKQTKNVRKKQSKEPENFSCYTIHVSTQSETQDIKCIFFQQTKNNKRQKWCMMRVIFLSSSST